jgi:hypothetical protein
MSIHSFHFISHSFLMRFKQLEKLAIVTGIGIIPFTVYRKPTPFVTTETKWRKR